MTYLSSYIHSVPALEEALHEFIPISQQMAISVKDYDGTTLTLSAPLAPNVNHQASAFGGSLFSVAALAGWGVLQLKLGEARINANTVIRGGEVSYDKPVFDPIICRCTLPGDFETFMSKLEKSGRASVILEPAIVLDTGTAMAFSGRYVVIRSDSAEQSD